MGHLSPCEEAAGRYARGGAEPGGSGYLPSGCRCELKAPQHHTQQGQELFVLVVKAVPEDNRTDDIGDSSAQEVSGIDEGAWGGAGRGGTAICVSVGGQPKVQPQGPELGARPPPIKPSLPGPERGSAPAVSLLVPHSAGSPAHRACPGGLRRGSPPLPGCAPRCRACPRRSRAAW